MQNWRQLFNAALVDRFVITIQDAGLDDLELNSWEQDYPEDPREAALQFGRDHDLTDVKDFPYW